MRDKLCLKGNCAVDSHCEMSLLALPVTKNCTSLHSNGLMTAVALAYSKMSCMRYGLLGIGLLMLNHGIVHNR